MPANFAPLSSWANYTFSPWSKSLAIDKNRLSHGGFVFNDTRKDGRRRGEGVGEPGRKKGEGEGKKQEGEGGGALYFESRCVQHDAYMH